MVDRLYNEPYTSYDSSYGEGKRSDYEAYIDRKLANILDRLSSLENRVDKIERELMLNEKEGKDMGPDD